MLNFLGKSIELPELLESKEIRRVNQLSLLSLYTNKPVILVCFTVVMPGKVKQNTVEDLVFSAGLKALETAFSPLIIKKEIHKKATGTEAFLLLKNITGAEAKKRCIELEQSKAYARLWDFDCLDSKGVPISRENLGAEERKCLICNKNARLCYKERTHSKNELLAKVLELAKEIENERT